MSLYQRGNVWWVDAYHEGQRIRASCRTVDREEAEFRYQQMLNAQPVKNRATLSDAERLVIESHAVKGVTNAATRDADRGMICSLTAEWVLSELRAQRYSCAVSGVQFSTASIPGARRRPWMPSIDKIDRGFPYGASNARIVCVAANIAMNEWGLQALQDLAAGVVWTRDYDKKIATEGSNVSDFKR